MFKCLGKSLKTEVKFIAIVKLKFMDSLGKEIKNVFPSGITKHLICFGKESISLLQGDMQQIIEKFTYEAIVGIEIDNKNLEVVSLWVQPSLMVNIKAKKITITAKFRADLIRNIMCYYSVYYMTTFFKVKEIKISIVNDIKEENKEKKKGLSRLYKQISDKNYE